jgi:hypothetical protein
MYSQRQFTPGKKSNSSRLLKYIAEYNVNSPLNCACIPDKYDKTVIGSDSASVRVSKNMRNSQIIRTSLGGTIQYGNFYLNQPLQLNYLGKVEGMSGGSGMPPKNF